MQQTSALSQAYLVIHLGSRWTDILRLQAGQTVTIGRSSENQVVVRDERVSRHHAQISHQNGGWQVADLGSRNGTQVAGQQIDKPHVLHAGDTILVAGCQILFTDQLSEAFSAGADAPGRVPRDAAHQETAVGLTLGKQRAAADPASAESEQSSGEPEADSLPSIVDRLAKSQWSAELDPADFSDLTSSKKWSFFYRLIFDLVACNKPEQAAGLALDRLLSEVGVMAGGIVGLEQSSTATGRKVKTDPKSGLQPETKMTVLAARQAPGRSYHRISDYLVHSVLRDQQAVLARNIQDDDRLSVARQSGQRTTTSILCAPIRSKMLFDASVGKSEAPNEKVVNQRMGQPSSGEEIIGLLHVYTQDDERMLTAEDLHLAVGVADNLSIALSQLQSNQRLASDLDSSKRTIQLLQQEIRQSNELIGSSSAMKQVQKEIGRAAPTTATVLIRGESGVGKELVARAIHQASMRSDGPMVCLNCAALAPTLLESELFGHEKGAFTGATERKIGKFEAANRGTLLLDEIGEMPHELQSKFLRVLEGHAFERLGGNSPIHTDVRVIAATNRDLEEAVRNNQFRSDLYYRLRVVEIQIPALRQRPEDIPELIEYFLQLFRPHAHRKLSGIEPKAMEVLVRHDWPGNVRELRNVIERAIVLGNGVTIDVEDLNLSSISIRADQSEGHSNSVFRPSTLEELEKSHVMAMLEYVKGNKSKAAQLLGIERSTLDRKLKRY